MCVEHRTLLLASKVLQTLAVSSSCVNSLTPSACKIGHVPTCGIVLKHTRALNKKLKRKEATPDFIWLSTSTLQDTCYHHYERVLSTCNVNGGSMSSVQMDIEWYTNLYSTRPACGLSDTQSDATHSAGVITPAFHTVKYPRTKPSVPLGCRYFRIFPTLMTMKNG
ncbi:unnamed protein product [Ixodes persulcatus]